MAKKFNITLFKDILKEKVDGSMKYSQGRVYLFWSVLVYYIMLGLITYKSMNPSMNLNVDMIKDITEALQWAILLFGGYVFGGKFIDVIKVIGGKGTSSPSSTPTETPSAPTLLNESKKGNEENLI